MTQVDRESLAAFSLTVTVTDDYVPPKDDTAIITIDVNPLNDNDLEEFVELQVGFVDSEKSWIVDVGELDKESFDLSVKNPNTPEEAPLREPLEIIEAMAALDEEAAGVTCPQNLYDSLC